MDDQDRAALEARIARLEEQSQRSKSRSAAETAFWAVMHSVLPQDARHHLRAAGREQLLAARVYLDTWISRLDEPGAEADNGLEPPPLQEKIKVK